MSIHTHQQAELLTRQAAAAIDLDVTKWLYDRDLMGLKKDDTAFLANTETFAPLRMVSDAYKLEVTLRMNILYRPQQDGSWLIQIARHDQGGAVMQSVYSHDDAMQLRVSSTVKFAALCAIVDDKYMP